LEILGNKINYSFLKMMRITEFCGNNFYLTVMDSETTFLEDYLYNLPEDKIAKHPLAERESSKLLQFKNGNISHESFSNVADMVPSNSLLFLNNTKVIAARLYFKKDTGAKIEVFLTEPISPHAEFQQALKVKNKCIWKCMIGNLKKWKEDNVLQLHLNDSIHLEARLVDRDQNHVEFSWEGEQAFLEIIENAGHVPLPPYLNRAEESEDKARYQTVFSELEGAVAAPTAGLHFTDQILREIENNGVKQDKVTLHVSAGTFRPIKSEDFKEHDMHNERIIINRKNIENIMNADGPIIAVGTTALRTLESTYWYGAKLTLDEETDFNITKNEAYAPALENISLTSAMTAIINKMNQLGVDELKGETEIFIYPGYEFKIVNALFTNFHQPGSTLILLVAAFIGPQWKKLYETALSSNYRFLSYGDTSLLFR
jgi:S-adenosylmethionine:tRNA ribosyltransferase-isomerase